MPVLRHPCALFSDTWPPADASQVSSLMGSALVTSLENIWQIRLKSAFVFGAVGQVTGAIGKWVCPKGNKSSRNQYRVEYTLIKLDLLQM